MTRVLPCGCSSSCCPLALLLHRLWAKKHLCAAAIEGTCKSCWYLSLDVSSVIPCTQQCIHAQSPFLFCLELALGFALTASIPKDILCQRADLCGFRFGGLVSKAGSLSRVGNNVLIKLVICMLIAVQLKLTLFSWKWRPSPN